MFYIKLEKDESLVITAKEPIYRGENLNQKIIYLIPKTIDDIDVATSHVYLNYIRGDGIPNVIKLENTETMYNEHYYQYTIPVERKITNAAGDLCTWLHFIPSSSEQVVAKSGECVLTIQDTKDIGDYDEQDDPVLPDLQDRVAFIENDVSKLKDSSHDHENIDEIKKISDGDVDKWNSIVLNMPESIEINDSKELIFAYSDGRTDNLGVVVGKDGANGKSAYEIAVAGGYKGTEVEWIASLQGEDGKMPTISIGDVVTGDAAEVTATNTDTGVALNFVLQRGEKGDPYTLTQADKEELVTMTLAALPDLDKVVF